MKKRKFSMPFVLGICLISLGIFTLLFFQIRTLVGNKISADVVSKMEALLPERSVGDPEIYSTTVMPVLQIDRTDFTALLEIKSMGIKLAVANSWDSGELYKSPARYYGSAYDNTLVIGGADSSKQFSFCGKIDQGVTVILTDMTGAEFTYKVSEVDRAKRAENEWLSDEESDLTLFCRDTYSMEYIAVRCVLEYS